MPHTKSQRVTGKRDQPSSVNFRQSYDPNLPTDAHSRRIDFLTETEVKQLVDGTKRSRNPERDALLILMLFRHGLRESEALMLRREWLDLNSATVWIERLKGGNSTYHPIAGDELRRIRAYLRTRTDELPWLFISERMSPLSDRSVRVIVAQAAAASGMRHVNPHMLRHSCGFYLNNKGHNTRLIQDYLGHVNPASTMLYTRTAAKQFEGLW